MYPKATLIYRLIVILITLSMLPVGMSQAQEGSFTEDFDDPSLPGWEFSPNVTVVDGILRVESEGFAFRGGLWGDMTLTIRTRQIGDGFLAIAYQASDTHAYHLVWGSL